MKKIFYSQKLAPYLFVLPFILSFLLFSVSGLQHDSDEFSENPAWGSHLYRVQELSTLAESAILHRPEHQRALYVLDVRYSDPPSDDFSCLFRQQKHAGPQPLRATLFVPILTSTIVSRDNISIIFW